MALKGNFDRTHLLGFDRQRKKIFLHQKCIGNEQDNRCDQVLKLKVAQMYPNIDPKIKHSTVYFKVMSFLEAQQSPNIWTIIVRNFFTKNF